MRSIKHKWSATVSNTVVDVDANTAICLRLMQVLNTTAASAPCYIQLFNKPAASVTLGVTTPILSFGLPGDAGMALPLPEDGWQLGGTGCSLACTATRTGAGAATIDVNLGWNN